MQNYSTIQLITIWALPVLLGITLHEAAHAMVANYFGDTTAKAMGRLSLNPIKHIDLFGTIIFPLLVGFLSQFHFLFGYAKPVPVNWGRLRNPRRDMIFVTLAGPMANFIMAALWAGACKLGIMLNPLQSHAAEFLVLSAQAGMMLNLVLAFINLIPIPPLDGSRVLESLLPTRASIAYMKLEPYGFFILLLLLISGALGLILSPLIRISLNLLFTLFGLV